MQRKHIPSLSPRYWVALTIVSVLGANLGDFSSHDLHLGHALGLLPTAVLLGAVFLVERRDLSWNQIYYWLAIIVIRARAFLGAPITSCRPGYCAAKYSAVALSS